jgi:predicted nuclease with TOPRIM domain
LFVGSHALLFHHHSCSVATLRRLAQQEQLLQATAEKIKIDLEEQYREVEERSAQLARSRTLESELPPLLEAKQAEVSDLEQRLSSHRKSLAHKEAVRKYKLDEFSKGLELFERYLGLEFVRTAGAQRAGSGITKEGV